MYICIYKYICEHIYKPAHVCIHIQRRMHTCDTDTYIYMWYIKITKIIVAIKL